MSYPSTPTMAQPAAQPTAGLPIEFMFRQIMEAVHKSVSNSSTSSMSSTDTVPSSKGRYRSSGLSATSSDRQTRAWSVRSRRVSTCVHRRFALLCGARHNAGRYADYCYVQLLPSHPHIITNMPALRPIVPNFDDLVNGGYHQDITSLRGVCRGALSVANECGGRLLRGHHGIRRVWIVVVQFIPRPASAASPAAE